MQSTLLRIRSLAQKIMLSAPYRDLGLVPNPRADEEDISAAEQRIGCNLPPSYRDFLLLHDGWPRFYDGASLLRAADLGHDLGHVLSAAATSAHSQNKPVISPKARSSSRSLVVFGVDPQQNTLFAFNTRKRFVDGEFEVIAWLNELGLKFRGFADFLGGIEELCLAELDSAEPQARSA